MVPQGNSPLTRCYDWYRWWIFPCHGMVIVRGSGLGWWASGIRGTLVLDKPNWCGSSMKMVFGSSSKIGQENVSQLKDVGPGRWLGVFVSISGVKSSAVSQRMWIGNKLSSIILYIHCVLNVYIYLHVCIYIYTWMNYNDLTSWRHWNHGECIEESSPNGRTIQLFRAIAVSELLSSQIYIYIWNMNFIFPYIGNFIPTDELHHFSEG